MVKRKRRKKIMWITIGIVAALALGIVVFLHTAQFGRIPQGERKERILRSPNYRDGRFQNIHHTPQLTSDKGFFAMFFGFLFRKEENQKPTAGIPAVKTDLKALDPAEDVIVWFGHSSYLVQADGRRILVDPVFSRAASPVPFFNKAFEGTDIYSPEDMPEIDYLFISHDHWDHLDYPTVRALMPKIGKIVCPLGVGEHFERWGFDPARIVEMDWEEETELDPGFRVFCLPARHFSGRGLSPNQSLWASFLWQTPSYTLFLGGDGGYDTHFAAIGERFGEIDLALLEAGQYGDGWKYIHMMPEETVQAGRDLKARAVFPIHNSKYALAYHTWDDPLKRVAAAHREGDFRLVTPLIGEPVLLKDTVRAYPRWWENAKENEQNNL